MRSAQDLASANIKLLTLPAIYSAVKRIVDDPASSAMELARLISNDPAMTARLLKLVNSAFWGFGGRIESVSRSVTLLGMIQVHDLVLANSVGSVFAGLDPARVDVAKFWRGSVFRALAATELARQSGLADTGRVFTQGLLSDIGHMILYQEVPALAARASESARGRPWELARLERELIGCDFAQVGGALADAWNLPRSFGAAIANQNDPERAGSHTLEAALLHLAGKLAESRSPDCSVTDCVARIAPFAWGSIGLDADRVPEILAAVEPNLSATIELFRPPNARVLPLRPQQRLRA